MERIGMLINKLKDQFEQKASPSQMAFTLQQIQSELSQLSVTPAQTSSESNGNHAFGTAKVAVMMPRSSHVAVPAAETQQEQVYEQVRVAERQVEREPVISQKLKDRETYEYDPMVDIPTLSHQNNIKEVNDAIAQGHESLNEKLKKEQTELFEKLKESPIRDLRKAIGVNDRFVFINELFRGDEPMYERSIKTINGFHIYAEAEYWINRELKVKLGWIENEAVRHFYQLVKRRFA